MVVARPVGKLPLEPDLKLLGRYHRWWRDLGGGYGRLEGGAFAL